MFSSVKKLSPLRIPVVVLLPLPPLLKDKGKRGGRELEDTHTLTYTHHTHTHMIFLRHRLICIHTQLHSPTFTFTQHHASMHTTTHTHTHTESAILRYNDPLATLLLNSRRLIFQKHVGKPQQFEFILNFRSRD